MITLGSTGIINQVISGLFVVYSKSVRAKDYVRVGDVEGEVIDVGFLATKLRTPKQEEVTIPHSVLVGTATTNYSRLAGDNGMAVTTSVTIRLRRSTLRSGFFHQGSLKADSGRRGGRCLYSNFSSARKVGRAFTLLPDIFARGGAQPVRGGRNR